MRIGRPGELVGSVTPKNPTAFFFVLGNSLPEGRYHAVLYLRPEGEPS